MVNGEDLVGPDARRATWSKERRGSDGTVGCGEREMEKHLRI